MAERDEIVAGFKLISPDQYKFMGCTNTRKVLEHWQDILDEIRSGGRTAIALVANRREKTPADLKTIIIAKQKLRDDLKIRHCSEGPLGNDWNDEKARAECVGLNKQIRELTEQLAAMG
jgi:hypothetical protein